MAELDTIYISSLPTGAAGGTKYLVQDDGSNTTKITVNNAVASASIVGSTALPTTAQTLTGAIAEHESDITAINSQMNGLTLTRSSITAGGSKAITTSASSSYMIVLTGSGVNLEHSIITVIQNASGAVPLYKEVVLGSAITISAAADKLTISNGSSSHTVYIAILTLRGSPPTV